MVWIHGKIEHFNIYLLRGFMNYFLKPSLDSAYKYRSAPFGAPHDVIVDEVDLCSRVLIAHILPTIQYHP